MDVDAGKCAHVVFIRYWRGILNDGTTFDLNDLCVILWLLKILVHDKFEFCIVLQSMHLSLVIR